MNSSDKVPLDSGARGLPLILGSAVTNSLNYYRVLFLTKYIASTLGALRFGYYEFSVFPGSSVGVF